MAIYELCVQESDFRDYMEGHVLLEGLSDSDYEKVAQEIIDRAGEPKDKLYTDFGRWFISTTYFDDAWEAFMHAIDDYIDMKAEEIVNEMTPEEIGTVNLSDAPLDEEGFTLIDRWYCEETCTYYPVGTTVREIEKDAEG